VLEYPYNCSEEERKVYWEKEKKNNEKAQPFYDKLKKLARGEHDTH
jgi:hypothetical protein